MNFGHHRAPAFMPDFVEQGFQFRPRGRHRLSSWLSRTSALRLQPSAAATVEASSRPPTTRAATCLPFQLRNCNYSRYLKKFNSRFPLSLFCLFLGFIDSVLDLISEVYSFFFTIIC
ncbi:hypothetical protein DEO72_LG3g1751 [Vigna unguiculata]|uniref:Uncharacterized protein n=1 Tax=Vigna unguiculata TaxID=3917 RepID=A0A4D6LF87_VIGUN|nr:hypothetical protein DEO72_LG3g1751 [Vigna unguiculata]